MAILQSDIDAAKAKVEQAQADLQKIESQFQAELPHLNALEEIRAFVERIPEEVKAEFTAAVDRAKALF